MPKLETKEVVDLLRTEIIGRSEIYHPFETTYRYYGSTPRFATEFSSILDGSITSQQELATLAK
ncbi:hypothetical protein FACS1894176_03670 [Bacteroidia bacterium]|nr:hypothetical protein FACS1894176_03670 [Bacteroidia bacterium]